MTFHLTEFGPRKAGEVVRVFDGPFGDAVILGFDEKGAVKLSRPYAYASLTGTTGPTVLMGSETLEFSAESFAWYYKRVVGGDRVMR